MFEPVQGGTRMRDRVRYAVWGGRLVNRLLVRRDIERIFAYRTAALRKLFPA
jgi:ligand-binding SRPBCC domain-containing protein